MQTKGDFQSIGLCA